MNTKQWKMLNQLAKVLPKSAPDFTDSEVCEAFAFGLDACELTDDELKHACQIAITQCSFFPSLAELKNFVHRKESKESLSERAQSEANDIWRKLSIFSPYYNAHGFLKALTPLQRKVFPTVASVRILADVTISEKTTLLAQWRTIMLGQLDRQEHEARASSVSLPSETKQNALE